VNILLVWYEVFLCEKIEFFLKGRLDYLSEGLILLTNDGELAQALERPSSEIERVFIINRCFS